MDFRHRTVIKQFLFASAGVLFLPSCMQEEGCASIELKNIQFNRKDEHLLSAICDTLLPASQAPGAEDIAAHLFVMKMLDDCTASDQQQKILRALRHLNNMASKKYGKEFHLCSLQQRNVMISMIRAGRQVPGDLVECYEAVKRFTIQAFASSRYYLSEVLSYGNMTASVV